MAPARRQHPLSDEYLSHDRLLQMAIAAAEGFSAICMPAGGAMERVGGVQCWRSSSTVPVFNGASILSEAQMNRNTFSALEDYFMPHGRPYSFITLEALAPKAHALMPALGYREYDSIPAMLLDDLPNAEFAMPELGEAQEPAKSAVAIPQSAHLRVAPIQDEDDLITFRTILSLSFHIFPSDVELIMAEPALHATNIRHYLAWLGGDPVGTISLVLGESLAGIWNVGTLSSYRGQGIATSMMRYALSEARALGYTSSALLSSNEGMSLYARLGYTTVGAVKVYTPG
ncbi:MAG TPA: GNAT family N-acetyltransferase [Chloroflexia bacterium]|nr:GNAT family N-acetyltransferase [Chloroflexia bacterium]